jgi:hypothetical protein
MKSILTCLLASSALLVACGGGAPDAKDPTKTDTSTPDTKAGDTSVKPTDAPAADAKPADSKPADVKTDAKPADPPPADEKCKDAPKVAAKTKKACMTECSKLEASSPAGSKCVPPKTACEEQCKTLK